MAERLEQAQNLVDQVVAEVEQGTLSTDQFTRWQQATLSTLDNQEFRAVVSDARTSLQEPSK